METSPDTRSAEIHLNQVDRGHQAVDHLRGTPNNPDILPRVDIRLEDTHHNLASSRVLPQAKAPLVDEVLQVTRSKEHRNNQEGTHHRDTSPDKIRHTPNQVRLRNSKDDRQCRANGVVPGNQGILPSKDTAPRAQEIPANNHSSSNSSNNVVDLLDLANKTKTSRESPIHGRILA